ncbi:MAG: cupin domain-containing protein [Rhodobacteraceae bacterium]|nr:cupin domain-containing protein [Paracoccaceae bacterium]
MSKPKPLKPLVQKTRAYLRNRPDCTAFWPTVETRPDHARRASSLAAMRAPCPMDGLADLPGNATPATQPLTRTVIDAAGSLDWVQVYKPGDPVGRGKIDRTAVSLLTGPGTEYCPEQGICGFYYLLPGVEYAAHAHPPREIYAILSGTARYWNERSGWETRGPGDVIHTPEWSWHAMTTVNEPVLILWAWIGDAIDRAPDLRAGDDGALPPGAFCGIKPETVRTGMPA